MIRKLLNLFLYNKKYNSIRNELFLSKSEDHYDLDYRIKFLDLENKL